MLIELLLGVLFLCSLLTQQGLIHAGGLPLALFPLHFILGVLVLHRGNDLMGILWFFSTAVLTPLIGFSSISPIAFIALAVTGPFLTRHLFTNRSVYALIGFGITLYVLMHMVSAAVEVIVGSPVFISDAFEPIALLFLIFGLYGGFVIATYVEKLLKRSFFVRNEHPHV